jgi:hypothetical protein
MCVMIEIIIDCDGQSSRQYFVLDTPLAMLIKLARWIRRGLGKALLYFLLSARQCTCGTPVTLSAYKYLLVVCKKVDCSCMSADRRKVNFKQQMS